MLGFPRCRPLQPQLLLAWLLCAVPAAASEVQLGGFSDVIKKVGEAGKKVGRAGKEGGKKVGKAGKEGGKKVGGAAKKAGQKVKHATD